jgi:hypothetical protein
MAIGLHSVLTMLRGFIAVAILTTGAASGQNAVPEIRNVQVVDISRFRESHPAFTFLATPLPSARETGQIGNYGGPLQYYLNSALSYPLHDVIVPFGGSAQVPLAHGRVELFGNMGGIFVPVRTTSPTMPNSWLVQTSLGIRVALDPAHHFWAGGSALHVVDFADKQRQSGAWSADLTFRSGR